MLGFPMTWQLAEAAEDLLPRVVDLSTLTG
jgi:hypothetical protein